jgi:hypothetical protein
MYTGYLFPWGNLPGERAGILYHVYRSLVSLGTEPASPTRDTGDLFPKGNLHGECSWPPPSMDTGDLFPTDKFSLGVILASPTMNTGEFFPWVNLPGD